MPFDNQKNASNRKKHGIGFEDVEAFDWHSAITTEDARDHYGETRFISYGMVRKRLHILVWTLRDGNVRPISFRKANSRERKFYEKKTH